MSYETKNGHKISKGTLCYHIGHLLMERNEELFDELAVEVLANYSPKARGSAKSRRVKDVRKILAVPELANQLGEIVRAAREIFPEQETTELPDCEDDEPVTE